MDDNRKAVRPFQWEKLGLVYEPNSDLNWQVTHAALPTKLHLYGSVYRIYFTSRDKEQRTHVGYFEIDLDKPDQIINSSKEPVLSPGKLGFFDDHGVQACSIISVDNKLYLYYLGWNVGQPSPLFYTSIGLAISNDGGLTFQKHSPAPILQRSIYDPWMVSGGTVKRVGDELVMYYLSGFDFNFVDGQPISKYDLKIAKSLDGIHWDREGKVALGLIGSETNISRLTIEKVNNQFIGFYPLKARNSAYRMGFATSENGLTWTRRDDLVNFPMSDLGWDSQAIDKMEVIAHKGKLYLFYNGNNFGRDGIGLATSNIE